MNRKDILKEFEDKYGKDFIIKSEPEDYIHKGVDPSFNINDIKDFISKAISQTREETIREVEKIVGRFTARVDLNNFGKILSQEDRKNHQDILWLKDKINKLKK